MTNPTGVKSIPIVSTLVADAIDYWTAATQLRQEPHVLNLLMGLYEI
jgi:hypothetical protein